MSKKITNFPIKQVTQCKYLGLIIPSNLSWDAHITNIVSVASRWLRFVKQRLKHCTSRTKLVAYTHLVRPLLEYADIIWDPHTQKNIACIEGVQNRVLRFIHHIYGRHVSITELRSSSELPTLQ